MPNLFKPKPPKRDGLLGQLIPDEIEVSINQTVPSVIKIEVSFPALDRLLAYLEASQGPPDPEAQRIIDELTARETQSNADLAASIDETQP
jgi:hypothetical protein